jgi:hypothetical protein
MVHPTFARPPCVVQFSTRRQFFAFLGRHNVPHQTWSKKDRNKVWKEVLEGDAVYCTAIVGPLGKRVAIRCICAVAARVVIEHPDHGLIVLIEFARNGDRYEPRQQKDSSLSEKVLLCTVTGTPREMPLETIQKCLSQETSIYVPELELLQSVQFMPVHSNLTGVPAGLGIDAAHVEVEYGRGTKFPGLYSLRQVAKYRVTLDIRHFRSKGHQDSGTKYFSFWRSVSDDRALQSFHESLLPTPD